MANTWTLLKAFLDQTFPPKASFSEDDIPDLSGKVVIVTGGNNGIGKETARALLSHHARVYLLCRNSDKAQAAIEDLKRDSGSTDVHFVQLDLSDFNSIRKASSEFMSKEGRLDVLFNNAGVMSSPIHELTSEGFDMQFGTNVVGPYLLTRLLLPLLISTASQEGIARIIITSSLGHMAIKGQELPIHWSTLRPKRIGDSEEERSDGEKLRRKLGLDQLYYQSKCGNILLSKELARRYGEQNVVSMALHPGTVQSDLGRHWTSTRRIIMGMFVKLGPTKQGAINQLYGGTVAADKAKELNGKYLIPWARVGEPHPLVSDQKLGERLWDWLEENAPLEEERQVPN